MPSDVIPKRPPGQRSVPERRTQEIPRASYELESVDGLCSRAGAACPSGIRLFQQGIVCRTVFLARPTECRGLGVLFYCAMRAIAISLVASRHRTASPSGSELGLESPCLQPPKPCHRSATSSSACAMTLALNLEHHICTQLHTRAPLAASSATSISPLLLTLLYGAKSLDQRPTPPFLSLPLAFSTATSPAPRALSLPAFRANFARASPFCAQMDPASAPHFEHLLRHYSRQQSGASPSFSAGLSIFPSLLGLQLVTPPHHPEHEDAVLSAEQAQQIFLSRLLLLLGCFVILCLLLF
eukprot:6214382-Pleurochrysis_carterae.AAC.2